MVARISNAPLEIRFGKGAFRVAADLCNAVADKDHPEFEELMEIHGEPFDPSDVEADEIPERIKYFAEWFSNTKTKKKKPR